MSDEAKTYKLTEKQIKSYLVEKASFDRADIGFKSFMKGLFIALDLPDKNYKFDETTMSFLVVDKLPAKE